MLVRIPDPETRLGCEPIQATQPEGGWFKPGVIEDFGFALSVARSFSQLPVVTVPMPDTLVNLADRQQTEANRLITEFENELRVRGVGDAELFPLLVFCGPLLA